MRKPLLLILIFLLPQSLSAQWYQVYNREGDVRVEDNGRMRPVELDEYLGAGWIVSIAPHSYLSLLDRDNNSVSVHGETLRSSIGELQSRPRPGFFSRLLSVFKGSSESDLAYVTYKDSAPDESAFIHAMLTHDFKGQYDISFETLKNGIPTTEFSIGDTLSFRVDNKEPFPLCIGLLWVDSEGNRLDCLGARDRLVFIPAGSSIDLSMTAIWVAPPAGVDNIYLFASKNSFRLTGLADNDRIWTDDVAGDVPIGFCKTSITIR